ncbi:YbaB/EbfC family nucleoid-associated protein [Amycolatopsis minnesotensis]|uniref:YbaB/EbfC DNA-binding family protein n=1 Tax=Amycolatopsis minnesotensis TaxID=337894 RepID=A0ABP5E1Z3_9PSEU
MDPTEWLRNYQKTLARASANAKAASENLSQVGGTATSPRGEVAVEVGPSGALESLDLTPASRALEAEQLAQLILATARQAQRAAGARVVEIMTDYVGEGPALEVVKRNLPGSPAEDGPRPDDREDDQYFIDPPEITS